MSSLSYLILKMGIIKLEIPCIFQWAHTETFVVWENHASGFLPVFRRGKSSSYFATRGLRRYGWTALCPGPALRFPGSPGAGGWRTLLEKVHNGRHEKQFLPRKTVSGLRNVAYQFRKGCPTPLGDCWLCCASEVVEVDGESWWPGEAPFGMASRCFLFSKNIWN